jgi:hypothetical protein
MTSNAGKMDEGSLSYKIYSKIIFLATYMKDLCLNTLIPANCYSLEGCKRTLPLLIDYFLQSSLIFEQCQLIDFVCPCDLSY